MGPETWFSVASALVVPGWLLLVLVPGWQKVPLLIAGVVLPALLSLLYLYLMVTNVWGTSGSFSSLAGVRSFFENPYLLLAGWVHYLAFDLFIGAWEVRDARRLAISHLAVIPCLLLTFLAGPIGLLLYLGLRVSLRSATLGNPAPAGER